MADPTPHALNPTLVERFTSFVHNNESDYDFLIQVVEALQQGAQHEAENATLAAEIENLEDKVADLESELDDVKQDYAEVQTSIQEALETIDRTFPC